MCLTPCRIEQVQVRRELGCPLIPRFRIGLRAAIHDPLERFGNRRIDCSRRRQRLLHPYHQAPRRRSRRGSPPAAPRPCRRGSGRTRRCQPDDRTAAPSPVPAPCTPACPRRRLRQSRRRPTIDRAIPKSMMTRLIVLVDHDVRGLQIAVDDAGLVRRAQAADDLLRDRRPPARRAACLRFFRIVARSPPWMYGIVMYLMPSISPRSWMRTTFLWVTCRASSSSRLNRRSRSRADRRIRGDLGTDDLQRDRDAELVVPRLIDGAHAADAEQANDVIARAEGRTGRERRHRSPGALPTANRVRRRHVRGRRRHRRHTGVSHGRRQIGEAPRPGSATVPRRVAASASRVKAPVGAGRPQAGQAAARSGSPAPQ